MVFIVGERKELTCHLQKGNPPPVVKWFKDGVELDERRLLLLNAKIYPNRSIILSDTKPTSQGMYQCQVSNTAGEDKMLVNLTVHSVPHINGEIQIVMKVNSGESIELPCDAQGYPKPTITWMKDGKGIPSTLPIIIFPKNSSLFISSATKDSNGTYECIAKNSAGKNKKRIDLMVKHPSTSKVIVNTPKEVNLLYNERGEIPCQVNSTMNYTVKWTKRDKSGSMVPVKGTQFTVKSSGSLTLTSVEKSDQGIYRCTAQSLSGENSSDVVVKVIEPVHVIVPTGIQKLKMHGDMILPCRASGSPVITLQWIKNGTILKEQIYTNSSDPLKRSEEIELNLHIEDGQNSHAGVYICKAQNKLNTDNASIEVEYLEPPKIKLKNSTFRSLIGSKYIMQCVATGSPEPTISWSQNGTKLISGKFAQVFKNGSLIIEKLSSSHTGLYTCRAENEAGEDSVEVPIDVGSIPWFEPTKEDTDVEVLKNGTIQCVVHGHPVPSVQWSHLNGSVILSKRFTLGSSCSMHLKDAQPEDSGTYTVTAKNKYGSENKTFRIHITGIEKPVLARSSREVVSIVGKQKELTCHLQKGNPPPAVKWFKDGVELDERRLWLLNAKIYPNRSIIVSDTKPESQGMYECRVSNAAGEDKVLVNVTVHSVPRISGGIQIVMKVKSGESIELPCDAQGYPKPTITWMKDGKRIPSTLPIIIFSKNSSLFISSATKETNGTYECIANNSAGKNKKTIDLIVKFPPPHVKTPEEVELVYKTKGEIPCQVNSELKYTVKWTKKDKSGTGSSYDL